MYMAAGIPKRPMWDKQTMHLWYGSNQDRLDRRLQSHMEFNHHSSPRKQHWIVANHAIEMPRVDNFLNNPMRQKSYRGIGCIVKGKIRLLVSIIP